MCEVEIPCYTLSVTKDHFCRQCSKRFVPNTSSKRRGYAFYCNMTCYNLDRGKNPGYYAVHKWLKKKFGKADFCEGESCSGISNNFQWALKRGCKYEKNRDSFLKLCVSCHRKYDFTPEKRKIISDFMKKRITTKETRDKMSIARAGKKLPKEWCKNISEGKKTWWAIKKSIQ